MNVEGINSVEENGSLEERREKVYQTFLTELQALDSSDGISNLSEKTAEKLGALQSSAQEQNIDFSVTFDNGFTLDGLRSGMNLYWGALNGFLSIDQFTSEKSSEKKTAAYEAAKSGIPTEIAEALDTLMQLRDERSEAA